MRVKRGFQISLAAVVLLVLLRISIGWHFLYQGLWKFANPSFSSKGFLAQAKGPLVEWYWSLIPDFEGRERLDVQRAIGRLRDQRDRFVSHYGLDEARRAEADARLESRIALARQYFDDHREAIDTYLHEIDRLAAIRRDPVQGRVPFVERRGWDKRRQLRAEAAPWLAWIDDNEAALDTDLGELLDAAGRAKGPPAETPARLQQIDRLTMYSNVAIGICLIVGLFTRFSALSGAVFLAMIVASQPPWPTIYPPDPPAAGRSMIVNKEFIEMLALALLAVTPVGHWGGLDWFVHRLVVRPLFGKGRAT